MWKKRGLTGIIILSILTTFLVGSSPMTREERIIVRALEEAGAKPSLYMWHHGGRTKDFYPRESVSTWVDALTDDLDIESARRVTEADGQRWTASGVWKRNIHIELNVINDRPRERFVQPYISIRLMGRGLSDAHLFRARNHLIRVLQQHHLEPRTHFSVQGTIQPPTRRESLRKEKIIARVLMRLGADEVESMKSERTTSVSAYTPLFNGGLETRGGTMNIQAAVKTGTDEKSVIFTLGTPIITIEY
ncbi:YwmB family TATA-box binding protein [Paludifilum halophilum]|nr:YwmB family TATA-box binding protein [Paludifilum halophilum]